MENWALFAEVFLLSSVEFCPYFTCLYQLSRGVVDLGNSLLMIYWKLEFHVVRRGRRSFK